MKTEQRSQRSSSVSHDYSPVPPRFPFPLENHAICHGEQEDLYNPHADKENTRERDEEEEGGVATSARTPCDVSAGISSSSLPLRKEEEEEEKSFFVRMRGKQAWDMENQKIP